MDRQEILNRVNLPYNATESQLKYAAVVEAYKENRKMELGVSDEDFELWEDEIAEYAETLLDRYNSDEVWQEEYNRYFVKGYGLSFTEEAIEKIQEDLMNKGIAVDIEQKSQMPLAPSVSQILKNYKETKNPDEFFLKGAF